jgi:hypothetical protein
MRVGLASCLCLLIAILIAPSAVADVNDLSNGALITHHVTAASYTTDVPTGSWCTYYSGLGDKVTTCDQQVNEIAGSMNGNKLWFVLAAWTEDKVCPSAEFGLDYTPSNGVDAGYQIMEQGACFPVSGLEIAGPTWPAPGNGIALTCTGDVNWSGNYIPVYYFWGYTYGAGTVDLIPDPQVPFIGFSNVNGESFWVDTDHRGKLGLGGTAGRRVCPQPPTPGACCFDSGNTCQLVSQAECMNLGGHFQGEGTTCDPNPCPTTWACCIGADCYVLPQADCVDTYGGRWMNGQTCEAVDCTAAPCCLHSGCQFLRSWECDAIGGDWHPELSNCLPNPCNQTFEIRPDGTGDFPTIQAAVDASFNSDVIILTDGVFTGTGNRDVDVQGRSITIKSAAGDPTRCVIDCQGTPSVPHRGFILSAAGESGAMIDGLSIVNGYAPFASGERLGGAIVCRGGAPTIRNCVLAGNRATAGAAIQCGSRSSPTIESCTFFGNEALADEGGTIDCRATSHPTIRQSLIGFAVRGRAVSCDGTSQPSSACSDIYGNPGGDWAGCIAGQLGTNGNISEDPLLCDPSSGDFHVACNSPCEARPPCARIGALGTGCTLFGISQIEDIPNDQGRQARVTWHAACDDRAGADTTVTSYSLWRRIERGITRLESEPALPEAAGTPPAYPPGQWDFVMSVPACGEDTYSAVAPTLCDSTIVDGPCWSTFFIRAHTPSPPVYVDSEPDSGYSVDNLAPAPPEELRLLGGTLLAWEEVTASDFDFFVVYGSDEQNLTGADRLGYTSGTTFDITGHPYGYYHVTSTDFSGNEGIPATIHGSGAVVIPGDAPITFSLRPNSPNPFRATTTIAFDLPSPARVTLSIFDASGRRLRTLVDGTLRTARYAVCWTGEDDTGRRLPPGIYFARLEAGSFSAAERIVMLD